MGGKIERSAFDFLGFLSVPVAIAKKNMGQLVSRVEPNSVVRHGWIQDNDVLFTVLGCQAVNSQQGGLLQDVDMESLQNLNHAWDGGVLRELKQTPHFPAEVVRVNGFCEGGLSDRGT